MAVIQIVKLREAGHVLKAAILSPIPVGNSEETASIMANMNATTVITSTEMDVMKTVLLKTQDHPNGYAQVEMKKPLISVMNGEEMDLGMKVLGFGTQDETCSGFKRKLVMTGT